MIIKKEKLGKKGKEKVENFIQKIPIKIKLLKITKKLLTIKLLMII